MNKTLHSVLKYASFLLLGVFVLLLQTTLLNRFPLFGVTPVLMPSFIALVGIMEGYKSGGAWGFVFGLMCDAYMPDTHSYFTVVLMFVGIIAGLFGPKISKKNFLSSIMWSFTLNSATCIIFALIYYAFSQGFYPVLIKVTLPEIIYSALFIPLLYLFTKLLHNLFENLKGAY